MMEYVPDRPLDPPEDTRPVVYECNECGEPIRASDLYFAPDGNAYCECCSEAAFHYAEYDEGEDFYKCEHCDTAIENGDGYYIFKEKIYCENCGDHSRNYAEHNIYEEEDDF